MRRATIGCCRYDFEGLAPWGRHLYPKTSPTTSSCDGATQSPTDNHTWSQCSRMNFDAYPDARDFAGYYMKAFETVTSHGSRSARTPAVFSALFSLAHVRYACCR
jgi:hypothetical protein